MRGNLGGDDRVQPFVEEATVNELDDHAVWECHHRLDERLWRNAKALLSINFHAATGHLALLDDDAGERAVDSRCVLVHRRQQELR